MDSTVRLTGTVRDSDGAPCDKIRVSLTTQRPGSWSVVVAEDGQFSFLVDPDESEWLELKAWGEWHGARVSTGVEMPRPCADIVIRLQTR